jgi:hypothetical protein
MAKITIEISVDETGAFSLAGLDGAGDLQVAFDDREDPAAASRTVRLVVDVPHEIEVLDVAIPASEAGAVKVSRA